MVVTDGPSRIGSGAGYNLVALMVLVAVLNIVVAAALPSVSQMVKRSKDAELIFRGMQYAEAIRVFQLRTGRYPVSLRELLETNPRCIRQLWTDPWNDEGTWGLILADRGATGREVAGGDTPGDERNQRSARRRLSQGRSTPEQVTPSENVLESERGRAPRRGQVVARGPIIGVRSLSKEDGVRSFMGSTKHSDWLFTADLVPMLAAPVVGENVPRLHSGWVGRPFPDGLEPGTGVRPDEEAATNPLDRQSQRDRRNRKKSGKRSNSRD